MPYASSYIGPIFLVRWREQYQISDGLPLEFEVKKYRARAHEPLTMVWMFAATMKGIADEARAPLARLIGATRQHCTAFHAVVEPVGFAQAVYRGILTTAFAASSGPPPITFHTSVEACLRVVAAAYDVEYEALMKTASFQQMLP